MVVKEYRTAMFINDIEINHMMFHAQQIEPDKYRERFSETKKARTGNGNFLLSCFDGHGRSKFW